MKNILKFMDIHFGFLHDQELGDNRQFIIIFFISPGVST